jgi:hypothetical protein
MNEIEAKIRAKELVSLYLNIFWFVVINIFLYILDYSIDFRIDWAYWVTFGWGIGVISHAFKAYISPNIQDKIAKDLMSKNNNDPK